MKEVNDAKGTSQRLGVPHTLGPLPEVVAPGTMPKLAFQRASDSSSASSFAYSSTLFAAPGLYPAEPAGECGLGPWKRDSDVTGRGGGREVVFLVLHCRVQMISTVCARGDSGALTGADMLEGGSWEQAM